MKAVVKEYAATVLSLIGTIGILYIIGNVLFHERGLLCRMIEFVMEGGV